MPQFDVFISHSSKDKTIARGLASDLSREGYEVWFDSDQIEGSEDWIQEIQDGVDNSKTVVVIWTENAKTSKWVDREITRADDRNTPILPLKFDDTSIDSILLQRIQYIDFKKGYFTSFPELVGILRKHIDEKSAEPSKLQRWKFEKHPYIRSRFLEENNYLQPKSSDFALNQCTSMLKLESYTSDFHKAKRIVSFVVLPIFEPLDVDVEETSKHFHFLDVKRGVGNQAGSPDEWFDFNDYNKTIRFQGEFVRYEGYRNQENQDILRLLRWTHDGVIELSSSYYFSFYDERFGRAVFSLIDILGAFWRFVGLAKNIYTQVGYQDRVQLLVNFRETQNTGLCVFAQDTNKRGWISPCDRSIVRDPQEKVCHDSMLQFVITAFISELIESNNSTRQIIEELSRRVQLAFNYAPRPVHYIPDTSDFPWHQMNHH